MIKRIDTPYELEQEFISYDRNYFSLDGYSFMLDCFEDDDELDVIGICCDFTEYGDYGASCDWSDFENDYGYMFPFEQFVSDNYIDENGDIEENFDEESAHSEWLDALADAIDGIACAYHLDNGNMLVIA